MFLSNKSLLLKIYRLLKYIKKFETLHEKDKKYKYHFPLRLNLKIINQFKIL